MGCHDLASFLESFYPSVAMKWCIRAAAETGRSAAVFVSQDMPELDANRFHLNSFELGDMPESTNALQQRTTDSKSARIWRGLCHGWRPAASPGGQLNSCCMRYAAKGSEGARHWLRIVLEPWRSGI